MLRSGFFFLFSVFLALSIHAAEVQRHGVIFEEWIRDTFFDGYQPDSYTQKWDIPASANNRHGHIPVNPKAIKYGTAIDLGDAVRQFDIDEPFILLVGFWRQEAEEKRFVKIVPVEIGVEQWKALWGPVTREELLHLDAVVKDRSLSPEDARQQAQTIKRRMPFTKATLVMNPKIGRDGQRRLQCSIRFKDFFAKLAPEMDPHPEDTPMLWGVPYPGTIHSEPRDFGSTAP